MGAGLGDPAVVHHDNQVACGSLGEPVGDDQSRAAGQGSVGGPVEQSGVGGSGLGGGLVEDGEVWVGEDDPGQGNLLRLGCGQVPAAGAELGVEAVREQCEEPAGAGRVERRMQLLVGC